MTASVRTPDGALAVGVARPVNGRARSFVLEEFWPPRRAGAYDEFCR
jgi:hypothetical protein